MENKILNLEGTAGYQRRIKCDGELSFLNDYGTTITGSVYDFSKNIPLARLTHTNARVSYVNVGERRYGTWCQLPVYRMHALAWGLDADVNRFNGSSGDKAALSGTVGYLKLLKDQPQILEELNPDSDINNFFILHYKIGNEKNECCRLLLPGGWSYSKLTGLITKNDQANIRYFDKKYRNLAKEYGELLQFDARTCQFYETGSNIHEEEKVQKPTMLVMYPWMLDSRGRVLDKYKHLFEKAEEPEAVEAPTNEELIEESSAAEAIAETSASIPSISDAVNAKLAELFTHQQQAKTSDELLAIRKRYDALVSELEDLIARVKQPVQDLNNKIVESMLK